MKQKNFHYLLIIMIASCHSLFSAGLSWKKMLFLNQQETVTCSHPMSPKNSLTIDAVWGSVCIKGSSHDILEVEAIKKGIDEELPLITIECSIKDGAGSIKTIEKKPGETSVTVDYKITVPQKISKITVISSNGPVTIENIHGSLDITTDHGDIIVNDANNTVHAKSTEKGSITIDQKEFPASASIFIETMKGNVDLKLPNRVNATLNARTLKGSITSYVPVTLEQRTTVLTKESWERLMRDVHGTLGSSGGAPITIDVTKGNITIAAK